MYKGIPVWALVAAAGQGRRLGLGYNKQFVVLGDRPLLVHTLQALAGAEEVDKLVVLVGADEVETCWEQVIRPYGLETKVDAVLVGGRERQDSVAVGLAYLREQGLAPQTLVLIHDGARPFVTKELVAATLAAAAAGGAALAAVPARDTVKLADTGGFVRDTLPREQVWLAQTPQVFRLGLLVEALAAAQAVGFRGTDDAMLVERWGKPVRLVEGSYHNFKITTPEDLAQAQIFVREIPAGIKQEPAAVSLANPSTGKEKRRQDGIVSLRTGIGYDVHRLVSGRPLILGGVQIPFPRGLEGHSDADVLLHALMDALLGAAALGDIGQHFPPADPEYQGISSLVLLARVRELLAAGGYQVNNVDVTVVAEAPRLAPYLPAMREKIAATLGIEGDCVSIKATTTEGLGFTGRGEGIAAWAVAGISRTKLSMRTYENL